MADPIDALRTSVVHLHDIGQSLSDAQLEAPAHPTEWSVADTLSHLSSGAVNTKRRLKDARPAQRRPPAAPSRCGTCATRRRPRDQAHDAVVADEVQSAAIDAVAFDDCATFTFTMGPMTFDYEEFINLRVTEHVVHTWDVEEAYDRDAILDQDGVPYIIDNLDLAVRYTAQPIGKEQVIEIRTTEPQREFTLTLSNDSVTLEPAEPSDTHNLEISAEAFIRLLYGRLDSDHIPASISYESLNDLRQVFPRCDACRFDSRSSLVRRVPADSLMNRSRGLSTASAPLLISNPTSSIFVTFPSRCSRAQRHRSARGATTRPR